MGDPQYQRSEEVIPRAWEIHPFQLPRFQHRIQRATQIRCPTVTKNQLGSTRYPNGQAKNLICSSKSATPPLKMSGTRKRKLPHLVQDIDRTPCRRLHSLWQCITPPPCLAPVWQYRTPPPGLAPVWQYRTPPPG